MIGIDNRAMRGTIKPPSLISLFCLALTISLYTVFRVQINSGFSFLLGDGYDGIIEGVIVNHWSFVFTGQRGWSEVGYFYPFSRTLGYNDSYFIYGLLAHILSFAGFDNFLRVELAHVIVRAIGFASMFLLTRAIAGGAIIPMLASMLFTTSISSSNSPHAQLLMISFVPLYCYLLYRSWTEFGSKPYIYASFAALLYGAMAMTAYYALYYMTLMIVIFCLIAYYHCDNKHHIIKSKVKIILFAAFSHFIGIVPFLATYIPKLRETGGQSYGAALAYTSKPWEVVNIGNSSWLWGDWLNTKFASAGLEMRGGEFTFGISPLVFLTLLALLAFKSKITDNHAKLTHPLLGTIFILIIFTVNIDGKSLWWLLYNLIPGAKGVRVVSRIYLVIDFAVILFSSIIVTSIWAKSQRPAKFIIIGVFLLLFLERVNVSPPINLSRNDHLNVIKDINPPPDRCKSFYVVNPTGYATNNQAIDSLYRTNVYAMLMSSVINIPTINGFSTFNPPGWDLAYDDINSYRIRVQDYVANNRIDPYPCEYDAVNSQWRFMP